MTNYYFLDRMAGRNLALRAGDADRERVAERLRRSHTEGRLDINEFQQRLERCYEAKTFGELEDLVADLPREQPDARRPTGWFTSWRWRLAPLAPILIVLIVLSAITGHHHGGSWLWIPIAFLVFRMWWWRRRRWYAARRGPEQWI